MTDVKRVWGTADNLNLEFTYVGGEQWETAVPPDTKDGIYAAELWAINSVGELGHWTGELYMCSGVCHIRIFSKPYQIWFKPRRYKICFGLKNKVIFERKCKHFV